MIWMLQIHAQSETLKQIVLWSKEAKLLIFLTIDVSHNAQERKQNMPEMSQRINNAKRIKNYEIGNILLL